jgi:hypothetical protein
MRSGTIRHIVAAMIAVALSATAAISSGHTAVADPNQDQKFFDLLGQGEIPPVDNANSLITTAKKVCARLDEGMPAGDLVELIRNNGFKDNPLARLEPQDRITRTITQFINASVQAYCPNDAGKIASITAYRSASPRIELVALVGPIHSGEIAPTKPFPVPAQPAPQVPQEIQPVPQEPPPPPRQAPPKPKQAPPPPPQEPPPPPEAPPAPEAPQEPPAPAAPGAGGNAPAPGAPGGGGNAPVPGAPGGGAGGGNTPASPTPDQPSPPGHIRLAP